MSFGFSRRRIVQRQNVATNWAPRSRPSNAESDNSFWCRNTNRNGWCFDALMGIQVLTDLINIMLHLYCGPTLEKLQVLPKEWLVGIVQSELHARCRVFWCQQLIFSVHQSCYTTHVWNTVYIYNVYFPELVERNIYRKTQTIFSSENWLNCGFLQLFPFNPSIDGTIYGWHHHAAQSTHCEALIPMIHQPMLRHGLVR